MIKKGTFEDFATQEITVEKELPKTLEEFAIKEIQNLRKENEDLKQQIEDYKAREKNQEKDIIFLRNLYNKLIEKIKEDLEPEIKTCNLNGQKYINIRTHKLWEVYPESYEYYKNLFNLKDECEENEPKEETIKS